MCYKMKSKVPFFEFDELEFHSKRIVHKQDPRYLLTESQKGNPEEVRNTWGTQEGVQSSDIKKGVQSFDIISIKASQS